jgi:hypothetical protein
MSPGLQRNSQEAVDLVHSTLEILKYVGYKSIGKPTGEGVPVEIVALPDLLFDFWSMYIDVPDGRPCSIGGRAALAACSLLHLLSPEDQTYRCKLLTKTGELGILLLTNELSKGRARDLFETDSRDLIVRRNGDPRCALRYFVDNQGQVVLHNDGRLEERILSGVGSDGSDLELSFSDFAGNPSLGEAIARSTVTYFSSLRTQGYCVLLEKLVDLCSKGSRTQFLCDLSLSDYTERNAIAEVIRYMVDIANSADATKLSLFAGVFVPQSGLSRIQELLGLPDAADGVPAVLAERLNLYVVTYGDSTGVTVFGPQGNSVARIEAHVIDFARQHVPERFKAGMVLAYATHRALAEVKGYNPGLFEQLDGEWSRTGFWNVCACYGAALANAAPRTETSFASLATLLEQYQPSKEHCPEALSLDRNVYKYLAATSEPFKSPGLENRYKELIRLAAFRRAGMLAKCPRVCVCPTEKQWCKVCEKRAGEEHPVAAIMIDLDGTLLDSTTERDLSLRAALEKILSAVTTARQALRDTGCSPDVRGMLRFFEKYVYDLWPLYRKWKYGDFRQQWNAEGWYIVLIALLEDHDLLAEIHGIVTQCSPEGKIDLKAVQRIDKENLLNAAYSDIKSKYADVISDALRTFEQRPMTAFREAFDFLSTLKQIPGIRL